MEVLTPAGLLLRRFEKGDRRALKATAHESTCAKRELVSLGGQFRVSRGQPTPIDGSLGASGIACVTETVVPADPVVVATFAFNCFARRSMSRAPRRGAVTVGRIADLPTPLSETVSVQSGSDRLYDTCMDAPVLSAGKACFRALITSSVTSSPTFRASADCMARVSESTTREIGRS